MNFFLCLAQLCNSPWPLQALSISAASRDAPPEGRQGVEGRDPRCRGKGSTATASPSCSSFCSLLMHQYFFQIVLGCFSPHYHSNVYFMGLQQRQVIPVARRGGAASLARCRGEGQEAAGAARPPYRHQPHTLPSSQALFSLPVLYSCPCSFLLSPSLTLLAGAAPAGANPQVLALPACTSQGCPGKAQEGCEGHRGYKSWLLWGEDPP